ncbi:MAG TPA: peptidylprolyl isomerase [Deltaproteobacteria bacterium]|nr:peptidylprolyl isomerase [Deltaproteobacteria bacterium]HRW79991.1 peptidylprolyl isomerase [Desulfomonilia bacterium]HNS89781.1 peptidylprolyl isomerase [Deltaproteobacteria bacterium]HOA44442.1 peptidylprolyl isomerase [Deltaproteobacteria bacterium]HOG85310.1 peptidylprolyl isomerase [Deltaproteobacteria bacterium]
MVQAARRGDKVRVNYTGKSEDGQVFESSVGLMPFMFTIGADEVIKGFEDAVIGMVPGERKTFVVEPEDGYGMYDEELVIEIPLDSLPEDLDLHVGMDFEVEDDDGNVIPAVVIEVMEHAVLIDANAPLAGRRVIYEVELLEIVGKKHHPRRTRGPTP